MSTTINKSRKRVKLECLECGSSFDDDYRKKHEINRHGGKRTKVKHFVAPENPFDASKRKIKHIPPSVSFIFYSILFYWDLESTTSCKL
ncbi:unnamed protein product [Macrosiphum euphorbiae]|uniref:C2H2-type domain-containing protein n=1 Tax=Macrosiphum euphorbiae TaxID=13131 RepID=A0AAV0Y859_9HEMI|nr:unnamed protein product [Macrosiphum euphorbiae]